jgi:hypothetical protein
MIDSVCGWSSGKTVDICSAGSSKANTTSTVTELSGSTTHHSRHRISLVLLSPDRKNVVVVDAETKAGLYARQTKRAQTTSHDLGTTRLFHSARDLQYIEHGT